MQVDNWDNETVVMDPDFYEIECPLLTEGIVLCPCGTCKKQFETDNITGFIQHISQAHEWDYRKDKRCEWCYETFKVKKSDRKTFCSDNCSRLHNAHGKESRGHVADDIRQLIGRDPKESVSLTKREMQEVRMQLKRIKLDNRSTKPCFGD